MTDVAIFLKDSSERVEFFLSRFVKPDSSYNAGLAEAMRYSLLAGGKRLRPALVYASYGIFSDDPDKVTPFAAAIEALHTYSLIHDDLPAMDNDDMRRGKPSNHKKFGEAQAILAGDALLTEAFGIISNPAYTPHFNDTIRMKAVFKLASAAGLNGMTGGQYADIEAEGKEADAETVEYIHNNKTAALIECAAALGAIAASADEKEVNALSSFGRYAGIAFQIRDDILDVTSSPDILGKSVMKDTANRKATYPSVYSLEKSEEKAREYSEKAAAALDVFGKRAKILIDIAKFITARPS
ncbi:MAG: polyprenyl synthetase family protein [Mucispirillum sp.]|nr:polyprenyl synthetase family protein [Mucispirillum sp.]